MMTIDETFAYIHQVTWRGSKPGLSRTRELLEKLGNPQDQLKFVHVAGTNGKGSVCMMLAEILKREGYRTGLYTSPYLYSFNERMRVDGENISDGELCEVTEYVRQYAESMDDLPTEFELITAVAMEYFVRKKCDIVVLEVGLGGALDSTNVIDTPVVAVITALGLDHTKELGPTIEDIAKAKAGIIKQGGAVAFYGGDDKTVRIIQNACEQTGSVLEIAHEGSADGYELGLKGRYQRNNAALVLTVVQLLNQRGFPVSAQSVSEGLALVKWPGRFEQLLKEPVFIIDGGHNPHGVQGTAESLRYYYPDQKIHFIMGVMADKDVGQMVDLLLPLAADFIAITPDNPRALEGEKLSALIQRKGGKADAAVSVRNAIDTAIAKAGKDGVVCAIGSLYSYKEVYSCLSALTLLQ